MIGSGDQITLVTPRPWMSTSRDFAQKLKKILLDQNTFRLFEAWVTSSKFSSLASLQAAVLLAALVAVDIQIESHPKLELGLFR